jgi:competence protein ComEA
MDDNITPDPSPRVTIATFVILAVMIGVGVFALLVTRPQPVQITIIPPQPTPTGLPSATPAPISVYVTGAVASPESLLVLAPGSRVQDAVEAAGGAAENADLARVNLAGILHDGDQVHVPSLEETQTVLPTPGGGGIVYINRATAEELATLPGIGPALAERIVAYRTANGAFADLAALDEVEGVGPALLEQLAPLISFEP